MTTNETTTADARALEARIRGRFVGPADDGYDGLRRVWNRRVDRRPAAIVRPTRAEDVAESVRFARERDLPVAVRGGGHSPAGYGTVDGGLVIDLSRMKGAWFDPEQRVAWAEPGLTWGEYNARSLAHGLATPGGDVAAVGLAGLSLAGGMGWLMRRFGMTVDNVLAVELVTADGSLITASDEEHPELFWALRGGGGNFGVATRIRYALHPVGTVFGGAIVHRATSAELRAYADAVMQSPDELTTISFVLTAPPLPFLPIEAHGTLVHLILPCHVGDPASGERAIRPFRALAGQKPLADTTGPTSYSALYDLTEMAATPRPHAVRNGFLRELTDETIDLLLEAMRRPSSPFGLVGLRELGGAVARVPADATAFAHRDKAFYLTIDNAWSDDEAPEPHLAWTEALWRAVAPHADGAYAGFLDDGGGEGGEARIRAAYTPETHERLAAVKARYDPENTFRLNPNVHPR